MPLLPSRPAPLPLWLLPRHRLPAGGHQTMQLLRLAPARPRAAATRARWSGNALLPHSTQALAGAAQVKPNWKSVGAERASEIPRDWQRFVAPLFERCVGAGSRQCEARR